MRRLMPKQQRGIKVICEEGEKSFPSNLWSDTLPLSSTELARGNGALICKHSTWKNLSRYLDRVESNFANTDPTCSFYHHFYFGKFHGTAYIFSWQKNARKHMLNKVYSWYFQFSEFSVILSIYMHCHHPYRKTQSADSGGCTHKFLVKWSFSMLEWIVPTRSPWVQPHSAHWTKPACIAQFWHHQWAI